MCFYRVLETVPGLPVERGSYLVVAPGRDRIRVVYPTRGDLPFPPRWIGWRVTIEECGVLRSASSR
jgi:hypothetical protein